MNIKQNILYAKKHIVDNIYSSVKVEGLGMTFPETETILENGRLEGKSFDEIHFVNDLKKAWGYLFEHIYDKLDLDTVKTFNRISGKYTVVNSGRIRNEWDEPVFIRGKNGEPVWTPEIPPKQEIIDDKIKSIYNSDDKTDAALELYMYLAKGQFFNDGNKRTASLVCNYVLIQNGKGLFIIPPEKHLDFIHNLVDYYLDENKKETFKGFLTENCILCHEEKTVGQKIQILRERDNLSRTDMAEILNIDAETLFKFERDEEYPTKKVISLLSDYFNVDAETIMPTINEENDCFEKDEELDLTDLTIKDNNRS